MTALKKLLTAMDAGDFYASVFGPITSGKNVKCPFPESHKDGEDGTPSFRVFADTGGTYCHGCGYKSTNPVYFWADYKKLKFDVALRQLYSKFVEPIISPAEYKVPHERLLANGLILKRLKQLRGLNADTVRKYKLGYDNRRLTIPIFNEFSMCVNIRRYDLFKTGGPKMVSWKEGFGRPRLYPLDYISSSDVFVTEGELDALLGIQEGMMCVSPSGGSQTWDEAWSRTMKGKVVRVIPDNDRPGIAGAEKRVASISKYAKECYLHRLPVEKEGEDLTDWILKYGGDRKKILKDLRGALKTLNSETSKAAQALFDVLDSVEGVKKNVSEENLVKRSEAIWEDLMAGGAFFRNAEGTLFYVREGTTAMKVTNSLGQFMSFLSSRSPLVNQSSSTGRFIYTHIINKAYAQSELSKTGVWSMYDGGKLYIHAGSDKLLRIDEKSSEIIKNAVNPERVLLELPVPTMAVSSPPDRRVNEGLTSLRELFMDNLSMQEENRYLLVCWLSCIFFRDYVKPKPLVRLLAKTASGKSTSSKLLSLLLYGEELLSHSASTIAATYEMSNRYPLLILDNLETRNMTPPLEDFLLVAATGGMKAKRQLSTDVGLVIQQTSSLILTNGIEPFNRHELIDRTLEIDLDLEKYGRRGFQEGKIIPKLKAERQKIMSSILYLIHRYVIPRIKKGEISRIMQEFGQHGKTRFNEYLALMSIVLDAFWGYMPLREYDRPHDLVNFWLDSQTRAEQKQDEGTNDVLYFISTFAERHDQLLGAIIRINKEEDKLEFKCTTRELLSDFRVLAKILGIKCPWQNENHLGTRIADSEEMLARAGWKKSRIVVNGRAYLRFELNLVRKEKNNGNRSKA